MRHQRLVKLQRSAAEIAVIGRMNFLKYIGVAADRPLPEYHHTASKDICTLHRYADRSLLVGACEIIAGTHADALASVHIHRIINGLPAALSEMVLDDGRDDRGFLP